MTVLLIAAIIVTGLVAYNAGWYFGFKRAYEYRDAWIELGRKMQKADDAADRFEISEDDRRAVGEAQKLLRRQREVRRENQNQN